MSNKKISQMTPNLTPVPGMEIPVNNNGVNEKILLSSIQGSYFGNHIEGLFNGVGAISNAADADHDITVAAGISCLDSTRAVFMGVSLAMTKQIDAAWAIGTNAGGRFSGVALSNNTTYHFFMIKNDITGALDYGFDISLTAANKPAGYTYYRKLWSVITDGSANIIGFTQIGKKCLWNVKFSCSIGDLNDGNNNRTNITQLSPTGIITSVNFSVYANSTSSGIFKYDFKSPCQSDESVKGDFVMGNLQGDYTIVSGMNFDRETDTSCQITGKADNGGDVNIFNMYTNSYIDNFL
jgi:hypothetical protein